MEIKKATTQKMNYYLWGVINAERFGKIEDGKKNWSENMKEIKKELSIGKEIDVYMETIELDDGKIKITAEFNFKTNGIKEYYEQHPELIKKAMKEAILTTMPPNMRKKYKNKIVEE